MKHTKNTTAPSVTSTNSQPVDKYLIRFISKLEEDPSTGCLLYTGAQSTNEYGIYTVAGKARLAHRYAYESFHGPCPSDKVVGHSSQCSSRTCCNPLHLKAITHSENTQQRVIDGTMFVPRRTRVKASAAEIADIRARFDRGESMYSIAKVHDRSQPYIKSVVSNSIHDPAEPSTKKGPKPARAVAKIKEAA